MDSRRKKNIISGQGACFTIEYQCSWTSDVGTALSEENNLKRHQDSSSVVQVSDSIKHRQPKKKKTFVSMLISGASFYIYVL